MSLVTRIGEQARRRTVSDDHSVDGATALFAIQNCIRLEARSDKLSAKAAKLWSMYACTLLEPHAPGEFDMTRQHRSADRLSSGRGCAIS